MNINNNTEKMKTLIFIIVALTSTLNSIAQSILYQNDSGQKAIVTLGQNGITLNLEGQVVFLPTNVMNTNPNFYMYSNNGGGAMITKDLDKLTVITFNPAGRYDYSYVSTINSNSYPQNNTQQYNNSNNGRSMTQIQNEIRKTEQRIRDNEATLKNLQDNNQSMTLWPTYQRMIQDDRNRLYQLQQELNGATRY